MTSQALASEFIRTSVENGLGEIVLDRPKALNALDTGMVRAIDATLRAWADDHEVVAVMITGAGGRAFCSGGDVRTVRQQWLEGLHDQAEGFFTEEYAMNLLIARFPKPIVAIADGICMGGGIGVAGHCSICIVTDRSLLAMPETAIGFIPDVGTTYLLPSAPGMAGRYLGVTGARMSGWDAVWSGLATHWVPADSLEALVAALRSTPADAAAIVNAAARWPSGHGSRPDADDPAWTGASELAAHRDEVDRMFASDDLGEVLAAIAAEPGDFARSTQASVVRMSPSAMRAALDLLAHPLATLEESLGRETQVAHRMIREHDFQEGVRSVLVDKDGQAAWSPGLDELLAQAPGQPAH